VGSSPNARQLALPQRQKSLLFNAPVDRLQQPAAVQMLQSQFAPQQQQPCTIIPGARSKFVCAPSLVCDAIGDGFGTCVQ
jgi:hypothetical protein